MSLFKPATAAGRKAKVLLYGGTGTGKTVAALSFPRCAVIDSEHGTDLYAERTDIKPFHVIHTQDAAEMLTAIDEIRADGGRSFDTLVIDPMTIFFDRMKAFHVEKNAVGKGLRYDQRSEVNERMKPIYQALTGLPVHLVVVAREAIDYKAGDRNNLIDSGVKPDIDSRANYLFDFIIHLDKTHRGTFEKYRGTTKVPGLLRVTWAALQPLVEAAEDKPAQPPASKEQIEAIKSFIAASKGIGLAAADWATALGVTRLTDYGDWTDAATAEKATKAGKAYQTTRLLNMGSSKAQQDTTN